jgi:MOSC domain-containing protein YiiM
VHGGPDKAVYAYASDEIQRWRDELGRDLGAAPFGENLTTGGIDGCGALVGERWPHRDDAAGGRSAPAAVMDWMRQRVT